MPYLSLQTNIALEESQTPALLEKLSASVSAMLGKPESYVMVALQSALPMMFAGGHQPLAYVQLKSLGLPAASTQEFSRTLCELLQAQLDIPPERIYIEFSDPARHMWGWNSTTF